LESIVLRHLSCIPNDGNETFYSSSKSVFNNKVLVHPRQNILIYQAMMMQQDSNPEVSMVLPRFELLFVLLLTVLFQISLHIATVMKLIM